VVEGAPLLRAYRVKTPIEGSNPSLSAKNWPCAGHFFERIIAAQPDFDMLLYTPRAEEATLRRPEVTE
jgi:hypothetical protein